MAKIVIGNLKSKMYFDEMVGYLEKVKGKVPYPSVIFCPTSLYIPYFQNAHLKVGLQNVFYQNEGSYTGEILPSQAVRMGIRYTIVGHSERREYLEENNTMIHDKVKAALDAKMGVVLCIGETAEEKENMETKNVLKRQIFIALKDIPNLTNVVIAYEPCWAIGTGKTPTNKELEKTIAFIREFTSTMIQKQDIRILYGGSVNLKNIHKLEKIKGINGYLIGTSSNNPREFLQIIEKILGKK